MPKGSSKSSDPIKSAKRVLDEVIAKHDPEAVAKEQADNIAACAQETRRRRVRTVGWVKGGRARAARLSVRKKTRDRKKGCQGSWGKKTTRQRDATVVGLRPGLGFARIALNFASFRANFISALKGPQ